MPTDVPETQAEPQATEAPTQAPVATEAPQATEESQPLENVGLELLGKIHTTVNADNISDYSFAGRALEYLTYIGEKFQNRSFGGLGDGNTHDAAANWIITELTNAGYLPQRAADL